MFDDVVLFSFIQIFNIPNGNATVQIVNIDTVVLSGVTHPIMRWLPPTGPSSAYDADKEWAWIEQTLNQSTADWLIVAGHYPGMLTEVCGSDFYLFIILSFR